MRFRHFTLRITNSVLTILGLALIVVTPCKAQTQPPSMNMSSGDSGTSTDLFVMLGSDFVRPGLLPKANYSIGIGHMFDFLKKDPFGDELTFSYTYEDSGSGFWHSDFGSHTESIGVMKNFTLPKTKLVSGYTCIQVGVSSFTGGAHIQNHFSNGDSLGAAIHFTDHHAVWVQEMFNKIVSAPWYTTTSVGYTRSW
jgi:hypothetical protein